MTINGWNISNAHARQFKAVFGYHQVTNISEWLAGSNIPAIFPNRIGFKPLQLVLCVKNNGRDAIRKDISTILSKLKGPAEIVLDGMEHSFYGILRSFNAEETAKKRWHTLTLDLDGYEFSNKVTATGSTSVSISNPGTLPTPAVVTVTPSAGIASLTLQGLGDAITLSNLQSGSAVVINGETGLITQGNNLKEADLYTLPIVAAGSSTVTCNRSTATVKVEFKPRYM